MIREARLEDLDALEQLERECFPQPWTRRLIESELAASGRINLVWSDDGLVAGYVLSMQIFEELHINKIGTLPRARRRGVARELMDAVSAIALDRGAERVSLEVRRTNAAAREFYESLGFTVAYVRRNYYPNGEDALVLSRSILSPPERSSPPGA